MDPKCSEYFWGELEDLSDRINRPIKDDRLAVNLCKFSGVYYP